MHRKNPESFVRIMIGSVFLFSKFACLKINLSCWTSGICHNAAVVHSVFPGLHSSLKVLAKQFWLFSETQLSEKQTESSYAEPLPSYI